MYAPKGSTKYCLRMLGMLWMVLALNWNAFASSNQNLVYHGRIVRPDGTAANSGSITFTLSLYSPSPSECLLYQETQSVSMTGSQGMFTLTLGAGTRVDGGAHSFNQSFINNASLSGLTCASGTSYAAGATDDRNLVVSFNDSGTTVALNAMKIKSVPFALQAHEIDGWGINNLVKVSAIGSPTTFTTTEMANAKALAGASCATNEILKWSGSAWACAADATGGSPADASYAAKGIVQFLTDAATSGITVSSGVANVNTGTGANQIVKLDASAKLPGVDGSALTNLNPANLSAAVPINKGGTGQITAVLGFNALSPITAKGDLITSNGTNNVPLPVGSNGYVLTADSAQATGLKWAAIPVNGTVTSVSSANADISVATGTTTPVLTLNSGTGANQIVKLDGTGKLPAVDGSALTNISATAYSGVLPIANGGTNSSTALNDDRVMISSGGKIVEASAMTNGQLLIGSTGAAPAIATLGSSNGISITTGAGSLSIATNATDANTASKIVSRDASGNFAAGAITNTSNILKGATSGNLTMTVPTTVTSYTLTWPSAVGGAGSFLTTDSSGNLSWGSPAAIADSSYAAKGAVQFLTDAATSGITVSSGVANVNTGTGANQIVKLDGSAKLPGVDGSALTNLNPANLSAAVPINKGGTGQITAILGFNALSPITAKGDLITSDGTNNVSLPVGSNGYVLTADSAQSTGLKWAAITAGTVTSVTSANSDISVATGTTTPVLTLNSGTGANQIVKLDGSAKLPAVDGSALTNLTATNLTGIVPVINGGTGANSLGSGNLLVGAGTGAVTSLASGLAGNVVYATGVAAWSSGTPDAAGLVDKSSTQTISGAKGFSNYVQMNAQNTLRFADSDSSNYVALRAPATVATDVTWTLPSADGASGYVLTTNGLGVLSWSSAATGTVTGTGTQNALTKWNNTSGALADSNLADDGTTVTVAAGKNLAMASGGGTSTQTYTGTTGTAHTITANSLTSGNILTLTSNSTAAAAGNNALNITISGANGTAGITRYGMKSAVTSTGSTSTNVAGYFSASGATNNYGLIVNAGSVGIGTATPAEQLEVNGAIKLGSTTNANAGTIRWDGINFQGYNGSAWTNFVPNPIAAGSCGSTDTYSAPGTYSYTVPASYGSITIRVWGAGGAGGNANNPVGTGAGGASSIASLGLVAGGGAAGGSASGGNTNLAFGAGGSASGGTINTTGGNGSPGDATAPMSGAGGTAPNGGTGGVAVTNNTSGVAGGAPGGGGSGASNTTVNSRGAGGGSGGYVEKTFTSGTLLPGTNINDIIVGAGGSATNGGAGGAGRVSIACSTSGTAPINNRGVMFMDSGQYSTASSFIYDSSGNLGVGVTTPAAKLHVAGSIVGGTGSGSTQCVNFATGNIQVSTYSSTNTVKIGGLVDGGAYTLILTGYTAGQTVTVSGYTDSGCTTAVTNGVDFGGSTSAATPTFTATGNTQLVTFIYSAARGVVYGAATTNFYR